MKRALSVCILLNALMFAGCSAGDTIKATAEQSINSYVNSIDVGPMVDKAGIELSDEQVEELNTKIHSALSEELSRIIKNIQESEDIRNAMKELDNIVKEQLSNYITDKSTTK